MPGPLGPQHEPVAAHHGQRGADGEHRAAVVGHRLRGRAPRRGHGLAEVHDVRLELHGAAHPAADHRELLHPVLVEGDVPVGVHGVRVDRHALEVTRIGGLEPQVQVTAGLGGPAVQAGHARQVPVELDQPVLRHPRRASGLGVQPVHVLGQDAGDPPLGRPAREDAVRLVRAGLVHAAPAHERARPVAVAGGRVVPELLVRHRPVAVQGPVRPPVVRDAGVRGHAGPGDHERAGLLHQTQQTPRRRLGVLQRCCLIHHPGDRPQGGLMPVQGRMPCGRHRARASSSSSSA